MLQVIKFTDPEDNEKYGDSYLINLQNGVNEPFVYAYSPKRDCYLTRGWSSIKFAYFMDDKGYKYDRFLKRIRENKKKN